MRRGAVLVLLLGGCDPAPADLREWTPEDHDQPGNAPAPQVEGTGEPGGENPALVSMAWRRHCLTCHGATGRGDGPQGPMFKVPDLTRKEWLEATSDEQIAEVIRKGRNKMPAFEQLPEPVIAGLVSRIRAGGKAH